MEEPRENLPWLGRMLTWVDRLGSANKMFWALIAACIIVFLLDFTFDGHGHFSAENIPGFYGFYGFVMFTGLILAAKLLRVFVKRREDYYGKFSVDHEDYPEDQLDRVRNDT